MSKNVAYVKYYQKNAQMSNFTPVCPTFIHDISYVYLITILSKIVPFLSLQ